MNPWPLVLAEFRHNRRGCAAIVALIGLAVALGAMSTALVRALRHAAALALSTDAMEKAQPILGNVQDLVRAVSFAFDGLLITAVLLIVVAHLSARRQSVGALRALGAPPVFLFATAWLHGALLIAVGVLVGLCAALGLAKALGAIASAAAGVEIDSAIDLPEVAFAAALLLAGSAFAAAPSLPLLRLPVAQLLRSG